MAGRRRGGLRAERDGGRLPGRRAAVHARGGTAHDSLRPELRLREEEGRDQPRARAGRGELAHRRLRRRGVLAGRDGGRARGGGSRRRRPGPHRGGARRAPQGRVRRARGLRRSIRGELMPKQPNMNQMMQQVQKMQAEMMKAQEELNNEVVEASAGGRMVTVKVTGELEIQEIRIDPEAVDPEDVDMLQDLVMAAVNEALRSAQELAANKMQQATGGLGGPGGLGGLGLPGL